ncbi:MAG TPA: GAF domain-containing protein [Candidatus Limnocylindria bacterium]|nr:GAF domain-containing protein [Candidatus Limnocylindria bacterium]
MARLLAVAGALVWILIGGRATLAVAYLALAFLILTALLIWWDDLRRGGPISLSEISPLVVFGDLTAAGLWMIASAPNERSVAFVVVIALGALAMYRLGTHGVTATAIAYLAGRIGQELVRVGLGIPTPIAHIFGETMVVILVLIILSATVAHYRGEQLSGARALRLARSLQRVATEVGQETAPEALFRSIARNALLLVDAHHATINRRRGADFAIVAGAGTGERAVGARAPAGRGIVGAVLRSRRAVAWDDYAEEPTAVPAVRDIGVRSIVGLPIVVQGEIAATLTVGRLQVRPFDENDVRALDGLASHASIALRNARIIEQARRVEAVSRELAAETGATSDVIRRIAEEVHEAYDTEFVLVAEVHGDIAVDRAGIGLAAPLSGTAAEEVGPLLQQVIRRREVVTVRDYAVEMRDETGGHARSLSDAGIHAAMAAPVMLGGDVVGAVGIATTDPDRTFDAIDRQGLFAFAQLAASALRSARQREDREQRIRRLSALNLLAWQLAGVHEPFGIARLAYEAAGILVARDSFYVARYDDAKREFDFVLEAEGTDVWAGTRSPLGTGPTSQVVLTGETYHAKGPADAVQRRGQTFGKTDWPSASAVHVPLKSRGRLVGVLSSQSYRTGAYDDEDIAVLQSLANLVATAFENAEHLAQMRELYLASVKALAAAVDARDPYTRSHSARVAALARTIGDEMRLSADQLRRVQLGALLHDIGKIGVPDAILNKPGPLTPDEWVLMRTHPAVGGSILAAVEPLRDLVPIVTTHHERFDGAGYPEKLAGESVPIEAYVVAAADAFEVIVSRRAYKQAQSVEFACSELVRCRGTQFHPDVVDAFLRVIERDRLQGAAYLRRVGAIEEEDMANVPGPGGVLEQFAASAHAHGRQLAVLQRLASEISAVLDIDELAGRLLRIVCESMGYENGFLLTLDDKHQSLVVRAAVGPSEPYVGQLLTRGIGISWWVIEHGQPQNITEAQKDARFYGPPNIQSVLCVPLQLGDERVGVLGIESPRLQAFGHEDEQLLTAVSHQVAAALRVAKLHQAAKTAAATDPLTGLPNRRTFFTRLSEELEGDPHAPLTVAVLDVNGLKQLNDEFGHGAGDEALVRIGEMLSAGVRDHDTVARIGGDEFAILFPGAPLLAAERVMRRVASNIAEGTLADGKQLPSIAWGVADASDRPITVDALVAAADRAMYRHKQLTRGSRASLA